MHASHLMMAALSALTPAALGATIPIVNAGFESPPTATFTNGNPTGWTIAGNSGGVWNINASPLGFWSVAAPGGSQVGWIASAGNPGGASLTQSLTDTLAANTTYTLSAYVGHPLGYGATLGTTFSIELLAGANVLAAYSGTAPEASFQQFSLNFDSTGSALVGQTLGIRLISSQPQSAFDQIQLTTNDGNVVIPLPHAGGMALAGLGILATRRKRA